MLHHPFWFCFFCPFCFVSSSSLVSLSLSLVFFPVFAGLTAHANLRVGDLVAAAAAALPLPPSADVDDYDYDNARWL